MGEEMLFMYLKGQLEGKTNEEIAHVHDLDLSVLEIWLEENKMRITRALPKVAKEIIAAYEVKKAHQEKEIEQLTDALLAKEKQRKQMNEKILTLIKGGEAVV